MRWDEGVLARDSNLGFGEHREARTLEMFLPRNLGHEATKPCIFRVVNVQLMS